MKTNKTLRERALEVIEPGKFIPATLQNVGDLVEVIRDLMTRPMDYVKPPRTGTVKVWINVYEETKPYDEWRCTVGHLSRMSADSCRGPARIACVEREITYTIGEGL